MAKSAEQEVEKMRLLEERIRAPSVWGRVSCGVRFEDCQEKRYDDVIRLLKKHYLPEEITYRSLKMAEDKEGVDEFVHNVRIWMKDKMSIVAIKEGTDKVVGALLMRIQDKHIGKQMLKGAMGLAASAFVPALAGIFTTSRLQAIGDDLGFQKYNEIYYVRYIVNDEKVFWDTGKGNYGAALMAYRIPDIEEPTEELKAQTSSRFAIQPVEEVGEEEEGELTEKTD